MNKFLPGVSVTTIVWADKDILNASQWDAAQGDDLKNQRPTIELNLPKLAEGKGAHIDDIAEAVIKSWLAIYIVFATREDLIRKRIRGDVSPEAEQVLYDANLKAVMKSPALKQKYADLAMDEILGGEWVVDEIYKQTADEVRATLSTWRDFSGKLDTFIGRCYLCGQQLLSPDATPMDMLDFVIETPHTTVKPTPFAEKVVNVCPKCLPLARQMGLEAKPLEIRMKEANDGS